MLVRLLLSTLLVVGLSAAVSPARASDPVDINVTATLERMATASPGEKEKYAAEALNEMRTAQRTMQKIQEKSPECVESQLPLVNSLVEVATFVEGELHRWQQAGDVARADTEFRKIVIALSTVRSMLAEANSCATGKSPDNAEASSTMSYSGTNEEQDETAADESFDSSFDVQDDPPDTSPFF